jgi:hypothetical protein
MAGISLYATHAYAWAALAAEPSGYTYIAYDHDDPETARDEALKSCSQVAANCEIWGDTVHDTAYIVARGPDGWGGAARRDPKEAADAAMEACREQSRDCRIITAAWDEGRTYTAVAISPSGRGFHISYEYDDRKVATNDAIKECEKNAPSGEKCDANSGYEHFFFAKAEGKDEQNHSMVGYGAAKSAAEAAKSAVKRCESGKNSLSSPCTVAWQYENPAPKAAPPSMKQYQALAKRNSAAWKAPQIASNYQTYHSCKSRCVNGSCEILRDDGKRFHAQVQSQYDSLSNQWVYPSPACPG